MDELNFTKGTTSGSNNKSVIIFAPKEERKSMTQRAIFCLQSSNTIEPFSIAIRLEDLVISDFPARFYRYEYKNVCKAIITDDRINAYYAVYGKQEKEFSFLQATPNGEYLVDSARKKILVNLTKKQILAYEDFHLTPVKPLDNISQCFVLFKTFKTGSIYTANGMDIFLYIIWRASIDLQTIKSIVDIESDNVYLYTLLARNMLGRKDTRVYIKWQMENFKRLLHEAVNLEGEKTLLESNLTAFTLQVDEALNNFVNLSEIPLLVGHKDLAKRLPVFDDIGIGIVRSLELRGGKTLVVSLSRREHELVKNKLNEYIDNFQLNDRLFLNFIMED